MILGIVVVLSVFRMTLFTSPSDLKSATKNGFVKQTVVSILGRYKVNPAVVKGMLITG